jgi:hypothetical protein
MVSVETVFEVGIGRVTQRAYMTLFFKKSIPFFGGKAVFSGAAASRIVTPPEVTSFYHTWPTTTLKSVDRFGLTIELRRRFVFFADSAASFMHAVRDTRLRASMTSTTTIVSATKGANGHGYFRSTVATANPSSARSCIMRISKSRQTTKALICNVYAFRGVEFASHFAMETSAARSLSHGEAANRNGSFIAAIAPADPPRAAYGILAGQPNGDQSSEAFTSDIFESGHNGSFRERLCQVAARRFSGGPSRIIAQEALT